MNRLEKENSPYLLQHLDNPVDWFPWCEDAFARAREQNKLVFLSIGYSTCHWCHVMAHESFEDEQVAELLNRDYISIKVDREERPDIDQVYMDVCQKITGSGGWPLTVFMTPEAKPFYAATYIPKDSRHGRPGMLNLLPWMAEKWASEPDFLTNSAREVVATLRRDVPGDSNHLIDDSAAVAAVKSLMNNFDPRYGGFSPAPKFPRPHDLTFLLKRYCLSGDAGCLPKVEKTLLSMRCGGLYDQLGYGFHRYSTDKEWLVPHFEKMLYDQAGLIQAFLMAWKVTGESFYAATVEETIAYLMRDMHAPEGGFFSAEDADSEGEEGKFYLWDTRELNDLIAVDGEGFCNAYNVAGQGNYHDEMTGQLTGKNILHLTPTSNDEVSQWVTAYSQQRKLLLESRAKRTRPHLDDKMITAWNGMMLSALSEAGRLLERDDYLQTAVKLVDFVLAHLYDDGRLLRRYRLGDSAIGGFAEDYAFVARGLLDLYAADFDSERLSQAVTLANALRELFQDPENGRLYDTARDAEELLVRPSSSFDGATPAASSIALEVFARLFLLTGDHAWRQSAELLLKSLSFEVARYPAGYTQLLQSADWLLQPTREIVIVGERGDTATEEMLSSVRCRLLPQTAVLFKSNSTPGSLASLAPFVGDMNAVSGNASAYVCSGFTCNAPLTDPSALAELLSNETFVKA